jgi:hypothetical protein
MSATASLQVQRQHDRSYRPLGEWFYFSMSLLIAVTLAAVGSRLVSSCPFVCLSACRGWLTYSVPATGILLMVNTAIDELT